MSVELFEQIEVADQHRVLGDQADRLPCLGSDLQASSRQFQRAFDGLVTVGDAREGDRGRLPSGSVQPVTEQVGSLVLDDAAGLEVESRIESEKLVAGTGVAIGTAVFATPIGIEAVGEGNVGAVVAADDRAGRVGEEFGAGTCLLYTSDAADE